MDRTCNLKKRIDTNEIKTQEIGKEMKLFSRRPKEKPTKKLPYTQSISYFIYI